MATQQYVYLHQHLSTLMVYPVGQPLRAAFEAALTYTHRRSLHGVEAKKRKKSMEFTDVQLAFSRPEEPEKYYTFLGLTERTAEFFTSFGVQPVVCRTQGIDLPWHEARMDIADVSSFRPGQLRMANVIATQRYAQLNGITGLGKSTLIRFMVGLFPYPDCRIAIVTPFVAVANALHRGLVEAYPNERIGKLGDGSQSIGRVTVSTVASMCRMDPRHTDILFFDEVHGAGAENAFEFVRAFDWSRKYGLSASTECRGDGSDLKVEAMFGPVRVTVDLEEGQRDGYIPPVDAVFYRRVNLPLPSGVGDDYKKTYAYRRNNERNADIAKVARHWEKQFPDPQILIMSDTLEHILRVKALLPDYTLIYSPAEADRIEELRQMGLIDDSFTPLKSRDKDRLTQEFERGRLKRVLSTTVLGTGVDAVNLDVIIRADGGTSEVTNIQYRGRVTRGERGIYVDFLDTGDPWTLRRSEKRMRSAKKAGWPVREIILEGLT